MPCQITAAGQALCLISAEKEVELGTLISFVPFQPMAAFANIYGPFTTLAVHLGFVGYLAKDHTLQRSNGVSTAHAPLHFALVGAE